MENKKILNDDQLSEISGGKITITEGQEKVEIIVKCGYNDSMAYAVALIKNALRSKGVPESALSELPKLIEPYYKTQKLKISWREGMPSVRCELILE